MVCGIGLLQERGHTHFTFFQGEPPPEISWLKDDEPISCRINIINTEGMSQLVIPSSTRSDSAIYTIRAKNSVGEAVFDIEVRVTGKGRKTDPLYDYFVSPEWRNFNSW